MKKIIHPFLTLSFTFYKLSWISNFHRQYDCITVFLYVSISFQRQHGCNFQTKTNDGNKFCCSTEILHWKFIRFKCTAKCTDIQVSFCSVHNISPAILCGFFFSFLNNSTYTRTSIWYFVCIVHTYSICMEYSLRNMGYFGYGCNYI